MGIAGKPVHYVVGEAPVGPPVGIGVNPNYLVYDEFVDPDGTTVAAHTPDIDVVGGGWDMPGNDTYIYSNRAQGTTFGQPHTAMINVGQSNVLVERDVSNMDSDIDAPGIWLRAYEHTAGVYRGFLVGIGDLTGTSPTFVIWKYDGTTAREAQTSMAAEGSLVGQTGQLTAWCNSTTVYGEFVVNGNTYNVQVSDTYNNTRTYVGMRNIDNRVNYCETFSAVAWAG